MRKTFTVLAKLLGLLTLYWTLGVLAEVASRISRWLNWGYAASAAALWWLAGLGAYFLLSLVLALGLIFKTDRIADWLRLSKDEEPEKGPSTHAILVTGSALIGLLALVFAIPSVARDFLRVAAYRNLWSASYTIPEFICSALRLTLGLVLTLRAKAVATFIESKTRTAQRETPTEEEKMGPSPDE